MAELFGEPVTVLSLTALSFQTGPVETLTAAR